MRLLATERMFRALGLVLLAIGVFELRSSKGRAEDAFENELPLIRPLARQLGWNIDDSKLVHHIEQAFSLSATTLTWIAVGLLVYAGLQVIEAVGLWMVERWGEYFAVGGDQLVPAPRNLRIDREDHVVEGRVAAGEHRCRRMADLEQATLRKC